ncbi:copper resistance protein B [Sphingomonas canadensis]|uniref:Copper resistance protein B n=1 Tax=Sphingomonas canadensis TaxID=1219257 RepID=A0ABW3H9S7_9SPHN|nr:copper resistance protein B [Sphingomonas canadensis]MCW3837307.1 copper resistance protein B [Sphingomonas canadensis]
MSTLFPRRHTLRTSGAALLLGMAPLGAIPAHAQHQHEPAPQESPSPSPADPSSPGAPPMEGMDRGAHPAAAGPSPDQSMAGMDMSGQSGGATMRMGAMQGGRAPADARDPNAHADGYENSTLPGFERADQISVGKVLIDELEFVRSQGQNGIAWSAQITQGGDSDKLWIRSQGVKLAHEPVDSDTSVEAFWWHATGPFWGRMLGVRQDVGPGAHSWLAAGIEGLAPYWFDIELTGYLGDDGRVAARAKASFDLRLTNRLILTPQAEVNAYSTSNVERSLGSGFTSAELGVRLRYEVARKVAPYIGYVWEPSFGSTADLRRARGERVSEGRFVAGLRLWW